MSETGQVVLKAHGFDPIALVEPAQTQRGLLVQRVGHLPKSFLPSASLRSRASPSGLASHLRGGEQQNERTGPLLWEVIFASGVVDAATPRETARDEVVTYGVGTLRQVMYISID
jgi:hypothetical protein